MPLNSGMKLVNPFTYVVAKVRAGVAKLEAFIGYIKARIAEKSTWAGIVGGFGGASSLHHPWDILSAIGGIIMVLIPTKSDK
jgi:hypothetical protein